MREFKLAIACALVSIACAAGAQPDDPEFQAKLESARARLDAAARDLAELHGDIQSHVEVIHGGMRDKAFLGILLGPSKGNGVSLVGVTPGGGAELAGLAAGDVVTAINGTVVGRDDGTISRVLEGVAPGDDVVVDFQRDGQGRSVTVTTQTPNLHGLIGALDLDIAIDTANEAVRSVRIALGGGLDVVDLNADLASYFGVNAGVLVLEAPATSNLRSGDIVLTVAGSAPADADDVRKRVEQSSGTLDWTVRRQGTEQTVSVDSNTLQTGPLTSGAHFKRIIRMHRHGGDSGVQVEEVEIEAP